MDDIFQVGDIIRSFRDKQMIYIVVSIEEREIKELFNMQKDGIVRLYTLYNLKTQMLRNTIDGIGYERV